MAKPRPKKSGGVPAAEPDLSHITADLRSLAVPIESLTPDPRNARVHGEQNLAAVAASLKLNGQQKPISVDANGVILAGNGTWTAAKSLGWKHIARVRSELTGARARAWAIQDNRSSELAEWDQAELELQTKEITESLEGLSITDLGFSDEQLKAMLVGDIEIAHGFAPKKAKPEPEGGPSEYAAVYKIIITCPHGRFHGELIAAIEKCDGPALAKLMKNIEFTAPNVT